jgi:hypothetical protein
VPVQAFIRDAARRRRRGDGVPVKFSDRWFPELAVASKYAVRPQLEHAWLDTAKKRLAATNGHIMILIPCEIDDGDTDGFVSVAAIEWARARLRDKGVGNDIQIACGDRLACDGASFDRPTVEHCTAFPPVDQAMPDQRPGDAGSVTFAVDANYIKRLANALGDGRDDEDRVAMVKLTMKLPAHGEPMHTPLLVTSNDDEPGDAIGALMPCKVTS